MVTHTRNCRRCGVEFSTMSPKKLYCSERCRMRDVKDRGVAKARLSEAERIEAEKEKAEVPAEEGERRKCKLCGKEFVVNPWRLWFCCDMHQRHWMQGGARNMKTIKE